MSSRAAPSHLQQFRLLETSPQIKAGDIASPPTWVASTPHDLYRRSPPVRTTIMLQSRASETMPKDG